VKQAEPQGHLSLDDYAGYAHLAGAVEALRGQTEKLLARLTGRTLWMINSTSEGGGVAELLPTQISMLRQLGLDVRWLVLEPKVAHFFPFTKRLHNLIHAADEALPAAEDRALYEQVNRAEAQQLATLLAPNDIVIVHDPQPAALCAFLPPSLSVRKIWRCHIGVDAETPGTDAAWSFLRPYLSVYDQTVFSMAEYVPAFLRDHAQIIHPSIDPLSHKNRDLSLHKLIGVLSDSDLVVAQWPLIAPQFEQRARRVQPDGSLAPANAREDIGLLARPIVTQVSRWDRLKGFLPLLDAFCLLKQNHGHFAPRHERHGRRLAAARLVLAGADPDAIDDDPEARSVFRELVDRYVALDAGMQADIAIVALPLGSRKQNALMVNALQRASEIVVQNSLREGFGLTVAEAMWKRIPVLGSAQACGVRLQVRDGVDGRLVADPEAVPALAETIAEMLADAECLEKWGRNAQRRVHDEFLIFSELQAWLRLLSG
jgi:trehalose synthase